MYRFGLWRGGMATPFELLAIGIGALFLLFVLILIVAVIVARSRRRERLMAEAVRAGQPELALYIVQGPKRFFAGLLLVGALIFLVIAVHDRQEELAVVSGVVAAVCLYVLLKRPKVTAGHPLPPPPPASPGQAQQADAQPPQEGERAAAGPPPPPPSPPVSVPSNGVFETALAVAMGILVVFAGLILLRVLHLPLLIIGVGVLVYYAINPERRTRCFKWLGRQAGRLRDWFEGKAGQG